MGGQVVAIFICPAAGEQMQRVPKVEAIVGKGLDGDRYFTGKGSFSFKLKGLLKKLLNMKRQVTLIDSASFLGNSFEYPDSRRNIVTKDVELEPLIEKEFQVGETLLYGVGPCDPCDLPSKLSGKKESFKKVFLGRGGLVANVIRGGWIRVGDLIVPSN